MRIVTLELPDDIADYLEAMSIEKRNQYATALLRQDMEEDTDIEPLTSSEKTALYESLTRGFADVDAGRVYPAEEVFARLRAKTMQTKSPQNDQHRDSE